MDWGRNRILRMSKNFGPMLSRLWTKVHEIWDDLGVRLCFPMPFPIAYVMLRSEDIRH